MKKIAILVSLVLFISGCNDKKRSPSETVTQYYEALTASDYTRVRTLVDDSVTIVEGGYITSYTHESFYEHFKWDSVFRTTYKIVEMTEQDNDVIVTVASHSLRYEFLKNNPLTCGFKISFKAGKIAKLEAMECVGADWNIWQKERDSLVNWTRINHPELDGFIHDLTMNGAVNYVKAIGFYQDREE